MSPSRPSQKPEGRGKQDAGAQTESGQPTQMPPQAGGATTATVGDTRPRELTTEETTMSANAAQSQSGPTMEPPQAVASSGGGQGVGAWNNNKKITAVWSINENRNVWVAIEGVGWKRLSTASDSATEALTIISALAKQTQSPYVNYRDEADGLIHEMYVW